MADEQTNINQSTGTQDLNQLLRQSPFGRLLDIQGANGNKLTVADIFGNVGAPGGGNSFSGSANFSADSPYGGNPFAGDNFWNIFAGGVNPSNISGSNSFSGGMPGGNTGAPAGFGGGNTGAPAGFGGGNTGAPAGFGGGNTGAPAGFGGGNTGAPAGFGGQMASSGIPASFAGGNIPQGLPTGSSSSTPVPEPSSVLGIAVIGLGIAATKFRQHQKRAVKVFNK